MKRPIHQPIPRACHHEQGAPDSCVAACVCMVRKRMGEPANEAEIRARIRELTVEGLRTAAEAFAWEARCIDWDEADEREALFALLAQGAWLVVDVYPGHMTMHSERLPGPPVSRHGPLVRRSPGDAARREDLRRRFPQYPHHAIVLVEEVTGGFRYLDPWFPRRGQPFFVGRAAFAVMWTGQVVIPQVAAISPLTSSALEALPSLALPGKKGTTMRYNPLGKTGLFVSELCLGTMTFGGKGFWEAIGKLGDKDVEALVGTALDAGVNFIDTADVYSEGESEKLLGAALRALDPPREQVVVATKVRGRVGPGVNQVGLSRGHIMASIDASLRRLGLEHVDLYQIHGFDPATPIEETVRALDDVVRSGKARYVGFSNLPAWVASKAITFAEQNGLARFQSAQVYYSIAGRDIEREIAPLCQSEGVAILPWSPLAGGLLSGKFDPEKKGPSDARRASFDFPPVNAERLPRVLAALRKVSEATNVSVARVALAWHLTRPFVTSVIIGAKTSAQLVDNLAAVDVTLSPEHVKLLDEASALPPEYPGWMIDWQNRDARGVAGGQPVIDRARQYLTTK